MKILTDGVKVAAFTLFPAIALAQGGPPFRSDDPDTPGNHHWEINLGFIGDRSPFGGSYSTPDIDINYGVGKRIQLSYEVPLSVQEIGGDSSHFAAGLGNSLLGVKYRFYQRHSKTRVRDGEREVKFSLSTYPQLLLNNPTRAVARDIAEPAPQLLLPLEANANYGWIRISGEVGYWLTGKDVSNSWIQGIVVGHEFRKEQHRTVRSARRAGRCRDPNAPGNHTGSRWQNPDRQKPVAPPDRDGWPRLSLCHSIQRPTRLDRVHRYPIPIG